MFEDYEKVKRFVFFNGKYKKPSCKGQKLGRYADILLSVVNISIDDFGELNEGQCKAIKIDTKIKD